MINSYMSKEELLREFWGDYKDVIRPRCFRIAERNKKSLLPVQKKRGQVWLRMKDLVTVKTGGNVYSSLLWVKYLNKTDIAIKTSIWFTYLDSKSGSKKIVLLPSEETVNALIIFTAGFFREWKEQLEVEGSDVEVQAEFFKWVEGKYKVYHNEEDHSKIEVDLNNLGAGIGHFDNGKYIFKHFLGDTKIGEMQEKVGQILDPLELWMEYYKKPEVNISAEEIDPEYDYFDAERRKALDEIFEKYG